LAVKYLQKKGYKIEERNFRTRFGEIDIVCWDAQTLVFVEVKTKIGHDFGEPEEMVDKRKMAQVQRMGEVYVEMSNLIPAGPGLATDVVQQGVSSQEYLQGDSFGEGWMGQCRVDVVAIVLKENGEVESMRHHEAVY